MKKYRSLASGALQTISDGTTADESSTGSTQRGIQIPDR